MAEENPLPHTSILQTSSAYLPEFTPYQPNPALDHTPEFQRRTCKDCQRLILELLEHPAGDSPSGYDNSESHRDGLLSTLVHISASCRICAVIFSQIICDRADIQHEFTHYHLSLSLKKNSFCVRLTKDSELAQSDKTTTKNIYGEFALYRSELPKEFSWLDYGIVYTPTWHEISVSCQPYLASRDYPWHEKAIDEIKAWVDACETEHDLCPQRHSSALPKRVLQIANDNVSLYVSERKEVQTDDQRYVALSYRWGNDLPLRLTKDTMSDFIEGQPISKLPQTLQDAVRISRNLGFKFIWIDALCIVQDDENDWVEQSALMADIYRHSSLNLCAADSAGCGSGIVEMAAPHLMEVAAATTQSTDTGLRETVVLVGGPISRYVIDWSGCGLLSRGWVFQEGLCSPRGLYVSRRHGLLWDCGTMIDMIDSDKPILTGDADHAFNPRNERRSFLSLTKLPKHDSMAVRNFSFTWYDWTSLYTSRYLTRKTDRLPAVAGMASYVASLSGMKYKAGLWEEDILRGLMWRRSSSGHANRVPGGAPTWSWASINGPVCYDAFFTMLVNKRGKIDHHAELDFEITDTIIEEEQAGTFGNVRRGEIKASGVLKHAATMLLREQWEPKWGFDIQPTEPEADVLEHCQVLRLARVYRDKQYTCPVVYFLIIRKTGRRENEYQRVGQGRIELKYDQHPNRLRFSFREWESPRLKPGPPEENMWGEPEKVAMTLV
ncbi:heterokaryon incompatibility protein [Fusarium tjaetaba]|uniref:Heterokaryon incompatibility protein n=1 Tax=Fusarium tjaetaba TaxID=1567544 RepID=A0A8H5VVT7_9HYPO|nr:heterokaryon incompatibility protein [Fusarium tjaetaba]KAF5636260.1 heterokaryon incompatibility protein [Fusarium tjaetaba]